MKEEDEEKWNKLAVGDTWLDLTDLLYPTVSFFRRLKLTK